ncbi:MAG: hypothetical protein V4527_18340 [Pseudomonadota bacterium]
MTQILVVKPGTLSSNDKGKLRKAGVVTVEADDPQDVRLIGVEGAPLNGDDITLAALTALNRDRNSAVTYAQQDFVALLQKIVARRSA